nr:GNAT family N-acetyltransferase [Thalassobacillus devorans]
MIEMTNYLREAPWDRRNFGMDTYEVTSPEEEALKETDETPGHFTLKVDPMVNKKPILEHGFFYADTLITPVCKKDQLVTFTENQFGITRDGSFDTIVSFSEGAFKMGRYHRDFHVKTETAEQRYINWLRDLYEADQVMFLTYEGEIAAYYAYQDNSILLIGMDEKLRGKGLAKPLVSKACEVLFSYGHEDLKTSVSAINFPSMQMFYSLGFKMKQAVDVYHKWNADVSDGV